MLSLVAANAHGFYKLDISIPQSPRQDACTCVDTLDCGCVLGLWTLGYPHTPRNHIRQLENASLVDTALTCVGMFAMLLLPRPAAPLRGPGRQVL